MDGIFGHKKGGGRAPQEAANTLRSTQIAEVAMLVSEGEAQGLVNGLKSVYLDGVAVENADASRNFDNVEFAYVVGTQGQAALPGLSAVQNEVAVGVQVDQATPVVRTITNSGIDHVRVTISVPQLTEQSSNGDLAGSQFEWVVDVQANGAGYVERWRETIKGKTTGTYAKAVKIELTGSAPWDVRVKRITADPASAAIVNRFTWASYTEITTVKLRYPNSAVAWLRLNAQFFGRVPTIAFDWLGQRVKVPANYNPLTRVYTGVWNGTFTTAWTNNPAWVLYDLITHTRYGLGEYVPPAIANKWTLYAIAQYCDALVNNGRGGQEPRFTINVVINTRAEAFTLLRDLAAVFRGMVFWHSAGVDFSQDAPQDASLLYTPANVLDGRFTYSDASEKTKHSMFICWWNDMAQFGKRVPEVYVDETLVAKYGVRELELQPLGLSSRGQAARVNRWARHSEQLESEVVTFAVGADGAAVQLGKVFKIADPNEAGERLGGRIRSATTTAVTLDAAVTLAVGETYTLTVLQPDTSDATALLTEQRTVTNAAGAVSVITVSAAFSVAPVAQTIWLLESNAVAATTWRCISVEEVAGKGQFRITGVAHNPSKYAAIESGLKLDQRPISRLTLVPPRPASLAFTETAYRVGQLFRSRVTVSWPEPARGLLYTVSWRLNGSAWTDVPETSVNSVDLDTLAAGTLNVRVKSVNALGNGSGVREDSFTVAGAGAMNWAGVAGRPVAFRVVARGYVDTASPAAEGLYNGETGGLLVGSARSYMMARVRRSDAVVTFSRQYEVYGVGSAGAGFTATDLANDLNATTAASIVIVWTSDEPLTNRLTGGLPAALYRCGASKAVFGSPQFKSRSAYVLVAIGGCGEGNGYEGYSGSVDSDTNAWCDAAFQLANGQLIVSGTSATPRTLLDYSYTGDLNATQDLTLVAHGAGTLTIAGNTVTKSSADTGSHDCGVYSKDAHTGGAFMSVLATTGTSVNNPVVGLNTDPATDANYGSIDYAIHWSTAANGIYAYENGVVVGPIGTWASGDVLSVVYDGARVYYLHNGTVLRTVNVAAGLKLFLDSSIQSQGDVLRQLRFGPMSAVANILPGQLASAAQGAALNDDPGCTDITAWNFNGAGVPSIASITDGIAGLTCLRVPGSTTTVDTKTIPLSPGKTYRVSVWARKTSGTGTFFLRLFCQDVSNTVVVFNLGLENITLSSTFTRYQGSLTVPATVVKGLGNSVSNYLGSGNTELQDFRVEEVINTDLLVDNAATAVYQDNVDLGGTSYGTGNARSFTITPPVNCQVELSAYFEADNINGDSGNYVEWRVTPAGGGVTSLGGTGAVNASKQQYTVISSFAAAAGVTLTFDLRVNKASTAGIRLWISKCRITQVKK